jgi:hypothetical protein
VREDPASPLILSPTHKKKKGRRATKLLVVPARLEL